MFMIRFNRGHQLLHSHKIAIFEVAIWWLLFKNFFWTFNNSLLNWYPVRMLNRWHALIVCFIMLTRQMTSKTTGKILHFRENHVSIWYGWKGSRNWTCYYGDTACVTTANDDTEETLSPKIRQHLHRLTISQNGRPHTTRVG